MEIGSEAIFQGSHKKCCETAHGHVHKYESFLLELKKYKNSGSVKFNMLIKIDAMGILETIIKILI